MSSPSDPQDLPSAASNTSPEGGIMSEEGSPRQTDGPLPAQGNTHENEMRNKLSRGGLGNKRSS